MRETASRVKKRSVCVALTAWQLRMRASRAVRTRFDVGATFFFVSRKAINTTRRVVVSVPYQLQKLYLMLMFSL